MPPDPFPDRVETPNNARKLDELREKLLAALRSAAVRGFFGTVNIEIQISDGHIQSYTNITKKVEKS